MVPLLASSFAAKSPPATLSLVRLNSRSAQTLQDQLLEQLRAAILERRLQPGQRLPSTRLLAEQLSVSRNTILAVFDQLFSEGYLRGSRGSGTYVSAELPDQLLKSRTAGSVARLPPLAVPSPPGALSTAPFRPCVPSVAEFPSSIWETLRRQVLNLRGARLLQYCSPAGQERLREQIALYVRDYRGVRCEVDQILVTTGAQQAFRIAARALIPLGKSVWCEDPSYLDARLAFADAGLTIAPLPLDADGLTIPRWQSGSPRLVYTTPSRQFPIGTTMSLARRMEWLDFARRHDVWIIEDDYDSEFRYEGRPLPSLQGLLPETQVIYVGTFSKSLYPSLRLGYIVAPLPHLRAFWEAKEIADLHSPAIDQEVLAVFMREGHFVRHLRKMRGIYAERAKTFANCVREDWGEFITLPPLVAGLNVAGWLQSGRAEIYAQLAANHGYQILSLSRYCLEAAIPPGFLFGFGASTPAQIRRAVRELAEIWKPLRRSRRVVTR